MKKLHVILLAFALVGWAALSSCDATSRPNDTQENVENPNDNLLGDQGDDTEYNEERADLREDVQTAQQDIANRISALREDMKIASAEAKVEINQRIERLEEAQLQLSADLDRMGQDMGDGWESFKMKVRKTLEDVEEDVDKDGGDADNNL